MKSIILLSCLVCLFTSGVKAQNSSIPCYQLIVDMASGTEPVSLFCLPDGNGMPLTQAQYSSGAGVDATITMTLLDCIGTPIASFPGEDCWLESVDFGLVPCTQGTIADSNTDASGTTHWTQTLAAGGSSHAGCYIVINGDTNGEAPLPLYFTSADANGDHQVNLYDVAWFSEHFFGAYDFAADFNYDGYLNLADVGRLALGVGVACP